MKIYFDSNFKITKREYEDYYRGSEYHNKIEVYFPKIAYMNYNYIYPVFNVKRPDNRQFGEFTLSHLDNSSEPNYVIWWDYLPSKALEVEGSLEITILFKYSDDGLYAKTSTGKVLLNVKDAVINEEDDVIYVGSGESLRNEINAIRNEYGYRLNKLEIHEIDTLYELDNYITPGIYKFIYNNEPFNLFVSEMGQYRSAAKGYYHRYISGSGFSDWTYSQYSVNGVSQYNANINYVRNSVIYYNGNHYISVISDNKGNIPTSENSGWKLYNPILNDSTDPENQVYIEKGESNLSFEDGHFNMSIFDTGYLTFGDGALDSEVNSSSEYVYNYKSIYSEGNISISAEKDITLNGKSWNRLYKQVQNLYSIESDFVEKTELEYEVKVPDNSSKYALINKIGGMSYVAKNIYTGAFLKDKTLTTEGLVSGGGKRMTTENYIPVNPLNNLRVSASYNDPNADGKAVFILCEYSNSSGNLVKRTAGLDLDKDILLDSITKFVKITLYSTNGQIADSFDVNSVLTNINIYENYFEGFRNSGVNEVVSNGVNLIELEEVESATQDGITYSVKNGVITAKGTNTKSSTTFLKFYFKNREKRNINGTYSINYFYEKLGGDIEYMRVERLDRGAGGTTTAFIYNGSTSNYLTETLSTALSHFTISVQTGKSIDITARPMLVKGSVVPTEYKEYEEPITTQIPENIQLLDGYGMGVDQTYNNYIDFERNVFVKKVEKITIDGNITKVIDIPATSEEIGKNRFRINGILPNKANQTINGNFVSTSDLPNFTDWTSYYNMSKNQIAIQNNQVFIILDKETASTVEEFRTWLNNNPFDMIYGFETPEEIPLSDLPDNFIEVENYGTIEFKNEYSQAVPSTITYYEKEV